MLKIILKNTVWLTLAELINKFTGLIIVILLTNYLPVSDFGKYSFAFAFVLIFGILAEFGFSTFLTRDIAQNLKDKSKLKKYLSNISTLKIFLSILTFFLVFIVINIFPKNHGLKELVYLAAIWVLINSFIQYYEGLFRAYEKMYYEVIIVSIAKISLLVLIFLAVIKKLSLNFIISSYSIAYLFALIVIILIIQKKYSRFSFKFDFDFWRFAIKESWPLGLAFALITIYFYSDTIFLGIFQSNKIVGIYSASYKIVFFLEAFRRLFATSLYPSIPKLYHTSKQHLKELILKTEKLSITFAIPLVFGGILLAEKILLLIFPKEYVAGKLAFQILLLGSLLMYANLTFPQFLHGINEQKKYLFVIASGAGSNIILNLLLIPKFSMIGAAIATVISHLLVFITAYYYTNRFLKINIFKFFLKPIIASLIMVLLLHILGLTVIPSIILGFIIYLTMMLIIKGVSIREIKGLFGKYQNNP